MTEYWMVAIYCNVNKCPISVGNTENTVRIDKDHTQLYGPFDTKKLAESWALDKLTIEEYRSHRVLLAYKGN